MKNNNLFQLLQTTLNLIPTRLSPMEPRPKAQPRSLCGGTPEGGLARLYGLRVKVLGFRVRVLGLQGTRKQTLIINRLKTPMKSCKDQIMKSR